MTDPEERIKVFSERLKALNEQLEAMKKFGVSEDVLKAYLCHKMKISEKAADKLIRTYEDFYKSFLRENIVHALERDQKEKKEEREKIQDNFKDKINIIDPNLLTKQKWKWNA